MSRAALPIRFKFLPFTHASTSETTMPAPRFLFAALLAATAVALPARAESGPQNWTPGPAEVKPGVPHETNCADGLDEDGDSLADCADADCFQAPNCKPGGMDENTDKKCADWVDNDGDGTIDCEDDDCAQPHITVCRGSWDATVVKQSAVATGDDEDEGGTAAAPKALPAPSSANTGTNGPGMDVAPSAPSAQPLNDVDPMTLIGTNGDMDGERTNEACADGIDNDLDGKTDCQDFGCRYDPGVTVCQPGGGMRMSTVVNFQGSGLYRETVGGNTFAQNANLDRLQLRALGQIPLVPNSFFLMSIRAERAIRMTFAMFQIPLGNFGHYLNINTGSGSLSTSLITSNANQLLLDPAFYVYRAMELGNGASLEVGGPVIPENRRLFFRAFASGGSGTPTGNIGGTFFRNGDTSFNWNAGAQLQLNIIGAFSRFDSPFLYTSVPTTLGMFLGAKFDQRSDERFPAANMFAMFRSGHLYASVEGYGKREIDFGSWQAGGVAQVAYLIIPKTLLFAADIGGFMATPYELASASSARLQRNEWQARAALHYYFWRNIGILTVRYLERHVEGGVSLTDVTMERSVISEIQFRF